MGYWSSPAGSSRCRQVTELGNYEDVIYQPDGILATTASLNPIQSTNIKAIIVDNVRIEPRQIPRLLWLLGIVGVIVVLYLLL